MSSKASGEPSLLLSTSVLYALRHAIMAARLSLNTSGSIPQGSKEAWSNSIDCMGVSQADVRGKGNDFFVLSAPATTVKIKQASRSMTHKENL